MLIIHTWILLNSLPVALISGKINILVYVNKLCLWEKQKGKWCVCCFFFLSCNRTSSFWFVCTSWHQGKIFSCLPTLTFPWPWLISGIANKSRLAIQILLIPKGNQRAFMHNTMCLCNHFKWIHNENCHEVCSSRWLFPCQPPENTDMLSFYLNSQQL